MKSLKLLFFSAAYFLVASVWAQENGSGNADNINRYAGGYASGSRTVLHDWVLSLESAGIVNRSVPAPYRLAVPLMAIDSSGTTLLATYTSIPGAAGSKGLLLFVRIPLK